MAIQIQIRPAPPSKRASTTCDFFTSTITGSQQRVEMIVFIK